MSGGTVSAATEVAPPPQATVRNGCDDENASAFPSDKPTASLAVLLRTMRRFGGRLARLSAPSYLKRKLATNEGTDEVYAKLQAKVGSPEFLANLARESRATTEEEEEDEVTFDLFDDEPAQAADDAGDDESYVFIEPEDVIASVADFVAACVAAHPNASSVSPETLQKALAKTLGELRDGRGGVRRAWDFGVGVVRGASWTYNTLASFTNPWIARLIVCAVYTSARVATMGAAAVVAP